MVRPRRRRGARRSRTPTRGRRRSSSRSILPLVVLLLMAVFQIAVVARDQVLTVHAARAAVREAAVDAGRGRVHAAAAGRARRRGGRRHARGEIGEPVVVVVHYRSRTNLPLVGALVPDPTLHGARRDAARAVMRRTNAAQSSDADARDRRRRRGAVRRGRRGSAARRLPRPGRRRAADAAALAGADQLALGTAQRGARQTADSTAHENGARLVVVHVRRHRGRGRGRDPRSGAGAGPGRGRPQPGSRVP